MRKRRKKTLNRENYTACIIVGIVTMLCFFPFWIAMVNSFGQETDIALNGFSVIPRTFSLEGYKYLIDNKGIILFRAFGVSIVVLIAGTIYTMFITVCFAYTVAQEKKDFPYANALSFFAWFTTVFSGGVIPWYILTTRYYGLSNNLWALFIPSGMNVFYMFIMKSNFRAVPKELIESAKIDGASNLTIFLSVALPLSRVGLVTIGLFTVLGYWNDFYLSLYLITRTELYPVQKMLYSMMANISQLLTGSISTEILSNITLPMNTAKMVMTVLTVFPVIIVFPFAQKYFVKGITIGAIKG